MASRYGIEVSDLITAALNLQIGEGISQRMQTVEAEDYIEMGEEWAEDKISDFIGIPLKPIPRRGTSTVPATPTSRNYPREFILAATYWTIGRLLHSEYFAIDPNASEAAGWAEEAAEVHITQFRSRSTFLVGGGRRRNPNPFMPPNIAPKEDPDKISNPR